LVSLSLLSHIKNKQPKIKGNHSTSWIEWSTTVSWGCSPSIGISICPSVLRRAWSRHRKYTGCNTCCFPQVRIITMSL
jgi:hypothetical protein